MKDNLIITSTLGFVCLLIVIYLIYRMFWAEPQGEEQVEIESSDDNPYLKQISEFRNNFINNLLGCLAIVWFVSPQNMNCRADLTDWNSNLLTIVYENHLVRCYIDWKRGMIRITYSFQNDCYRFSKSKKFYLNNHTINFESFTDWATAIYKTILVNSWKSTDDQVIECMARGREMAGDETLKDTDFQNMIFEMWADFIIHNNKKEVEKDLITFSSLTAYVIKYCPEQLKNFVEEHKKINSKELW